MLANCNCTLLKMSCVHRDNKTETSLNLHINKY
uniref:Uncharacterized protein n=1 Tax=Arundo donax TaxID=35708 RepID=A0A0A9BB07_ARUDO